MICKRCGSQMFNNATSCPFCGAVIGAENETDPNRNLIPGLESLSDPVPASPAAPPQPDSPVQPPQPDSGALPKNPFADDPIPKNPFAQNPSPQNPLPPLGGTGGASQSFAPLPPITDVRDRGEGVLGRIPMHLAGKIMICIALLCFFLPFVTVSCSSPELGSDKVLATYSGFELMTGNLDYEDPAAKMNESLNGMFGEGFFDEYADNDEDDEENGDDDNGYGFGFGDIGAGDDMLSLFGNVQKEQSEAAAASAEAAEQSEQLQRKNYILLAAFLFGILAFILLLIKDKKLEIFSMLCSVIAAMLTLVSSITFTAFYKITQSENMADRIVVKTRYGVFMTVFFFILAALAALKAQIDSNRNTGDY